jgi:hypothetical protein
MFASVQSETMAMFRQDGATGHCSILWRKGHRPNMPILQDDRQRIFLQDLHFKTSQFKIFIHLKKSSHFSKNSHVKKSSPSGRASFHQKILLQNGQSFEQKQSCLQEQSFLPTFQHGDGHFKTIWWQGHH